jgi:hypothetical protein
MSQQIFSEADLIGARGFLVANIDRLLPGWLDSPIGLLGMHWISDTTPSASLLVDIAARFMRLSRSVTHRSTAVLETKFRQLFQIDTERQFEELYSEIAVADTLALAAPPLALEPIISPSARRSVKSTKSPDFAIKTDEDVTFVEATHSYWKFFLDFNDFSRELKRRFEHSLSPQDGILDIRVSVPTASEPSRLLALHSKYTISQIRRRPEGEIEVDVGCGRPAQIKWRVLRVNEAYAESPFVFSAPLGSDIKGIAFRMLTVEDDANEGYEAPALPELIYKSFKNTVDGKKAQCPREAPFLLAVGSGDHRLPVETFSAIAFQRLFPNPTYSWISGLLTFTSMKSFNRGSPVPILRAHFNPGASYPVPDSLRRLFPEEDGK